MPTNGAAEALWLLPAALRPALAACVHPGFTEAEAALRAHGVPVARVLRDPERDFALDPAAVPDAADLVVVGNPASPSGTLDPAAALLALRRPGRVVAVDEAFMDLVPGEPASLARERLEDVIVVRSLTKSLGIPGLRAGYAIAPPAARRAAARGAPALVGQRARARRARRRRWAPRGPGRGGRASATRSAPTWPNACAGCPGCAPGPARPTSAWSRSPTGPGWSPRCANAASPCARPRRSPGSVPATCASPPARRPRTSASPPRSPRRSARRSSAASAPLAVVGIGADGWAGLGEPAREALRAAELIVGSERQLALLPEDTGAERRPWPSPIDPLVDELAAGPARATCVLASGDPMLHGIGATLARRLGPRAPARPPAPLGVRARLRAARLAGGRGRAGQRRRRARRGGGPRCCSPAGASSPTSRARTAPRLVARVARERGFGASRLVVLEQLGGAGERLHETHRRRLGRAHRRPAARRRARLRRRARRAAAAASRRACPTTPTRTTASSPSAASARSRSPRSARRRASCSGTSAPAAARSAIEWLRAERTARAVAIEARADRAERVARQRAPARRARGSTVRHGQRPRGAGGPRRARRGLRRRRRHRARPARRAAGRRCARRPPRRQRGHARGRGGAGRGRRRAARRRAASESRSSTPSRSAASPAGGRSCRWSSGPRAGEPSDRPLHRRRPGRPRPAHAARARG